MADFFIPENVFTILKEKVPNARELEKYLYIVNFIFLRKLISPQSYEDGVRISSKALKKMVGKYMCEYLADLIRWKVIRRVEGYIPSVKSFAYRLCEQFESDKIYCYPLCQSYRLFQKVANEVPQDEICRETVNVLRSIKVTNGGLRYLMGNNKCPHFRQLCFEYMQRNRIHQPGWSKHTGFLIRQSDIMLFSFLIGPLNCTRPHPGSRIYSNFTCLPKTHREYLTLNNRPLEITDVKNAQPLICAGVVIKHLTTNSGSQHFILPRDVILYKTTCESGMIYESLATEINYCLTPENRKEFKERFYREIFYCKKPRGQIAKAFKNLYPNVERVIRELKGTHHKGFAHMLGRAEAKVMIDDCLRKLYDLNRPVLSIHDGIAVTNDKDLALAEQFIKDAMKEFYDLDISFSQERDYWFDTDSIAV